MRADVTESVGVGAGDRQGVGEGFSSSTTLVPGAVPTRTALQATSMSAKSKFRPKANNFALTSVFSILYLSAAQLLLKPTVLDIS